MNGRQLHGKCSEIRRGLRTPGQTLVKLGFQREPAHLHGPLDGLAFTGNAQFVIHPNDGHHAGIQVGCKAAIEFELCLAQRLATCDLPAWKNPETRSRRAP